jgi:uncharacterized protein YndB with AHSA1/START domain
MVKHKVIGETKDAGFQFGLRKTFHTSFKDVWKFMFSPQGLGIWLGTLENELKVKAPYKTKEGIEGEIRLLKQYSHIRLTWKKKEWHNVSQLQVRVIDNNGKAVISFHHDHLVGPDQRNEVKEYWNRVMEELSKVLS